MCCKRRPHIWPLRWLSNKCVSRIQICHTGWAVKTMCNTLPPISRDGNIPVADCMSSRLKTIQINGGVECTLCMTKPWWILLDGGLTTTVPWRTVASSSCAINKDPLMRGPPCITGFRVRHRCRCKKKLKNATYFAYNGLLWGLPPRNLTFLESPHRIGVKL